MNVFTLGRNVIVMKLYHEGRFLWFYCLFNKSVWIALFKIAYLKHFIVFSSAGYQINHGFDRRIQSTGGSGVYEVYSG